MVGAQNYAHNATAGRASIDVDLYVVLMFYAVAFDGAASVHPAEHTDTYFWGESKDKECMEQLHAASHTYVVQRLLLLYHHNHLNLVDEHPAEITISPSRG